MNPTAPVYIISKGRFDVRLTSDALCRMGVPHSMIVESQELDLYAAEIDDSMVTLLALPQTYKDAYDTFPEDTASLVSNAENASTGSGPARNFARAHSAEAGHAWHWLMDDNISAFYRLNENRKIRVGDGTIFKAMEDFTWRYQNVAMSGPNYHFFAKRKQLIPPFIKNTRLYSCILIRNDPHFQWRCRYNEDVDLSLRVLKAGHCTIQFNAFLQGKAATQTVKGGNTEEFYAEEGTIPKSKMLAQLHPDVTTLVMKFGRPHHHVDYREFRGMALVKRDDVKVPQGVNNYGLKVGTRA
jgi:hypothetical protein